jgi:hypothetical protein
MCARPDLERFFCHDEKPDEMPSEDQALRCGRHGPADDRGLANIRKALGQRTAEMERMRKAVRVLMAHPGHSAVLAIRCGAKDLHLHRRPQRRLDVRMLAAVLPRIGL